MAQNRSRNWNIVINGEQLPETSKISEILSETKPKHYAFILHCRDKEKKDHYHIVIEYENARTFESLQKKFQTWHIEPCKSLVSSIQYLIHKNDQSKEQYNIDEIITNNTEWLNTQMNLIQDYINDERQLIQDILGGKYKTYFDLILSNDYSLEWLNRRRQVILDVYTAIGNETWKNLK